MSDADYTFAELFPVPEIPDRLPLRAGEKRQAISTIYHWLNLAGNPRPTLRSVLIGRTRYTTERWLHEFFESPVTPPRHRTPARREREKARAKQALAEAGI